ncbi:undecaprenyl-diphosphatase [Chromobacterium phragmitis]|uniref:Phosphatase PAP2 family protein n=1 Tax=Chromobacterium phragmitis TaxID=2202141 RepID=A0A344UN51_9NEIS|nr:phosphatase PAP2 family protein [Chromobacterium phragmitis]AXE31317.1 undecaprenyl-diphosphatase [Chromobacterium phragmitis]AXE36699.1 undecaprenyl-diphosphatase [Chromobacterium phragmitis]
MPQVELLNQTLFLLINATPETPALALKLATFIAQDLLRLLPLWLAALWLWRPELRDSALKSVALTGAALLGNWLIGLAWPHPRPFAIPLGHVFLVHDATPSFPSNHGTIFAMMALCWHFSPARGWGWLLAAAGAAVAWSRVFLGVHFPLDMLGALLVAIGWFAVLSPAWNRLGRNWTSGLEALYRRLLARPIAAGWIRG